MHSIVTSEPVFYPMPPDTARIQFLTRIGNSQDITGGQNKFKTFIAGPEDVLPIIKPYGLDILGGKIFICDPGIAGLHIIDLQNKSFKYFIPGGRGRLRVPRNCFIDMNENLYVADPERKQVVIFDENQEYKGEIGGNDNFKPTDVVVSGDTILVTDPLNNRINAYDMTNLELLYSFPEGVEVGDIKWLYNPQNLFVAGGKIYVTDFGNCMVKLYNMGGEFLSSVGSLGRQIGQFVRPKGISVDEDQNLFVVDAAFENVQMFNKEGQLLLYFGGPYIKSGDMYLPAKVTIDYEHFSYFEKYVAPAYQLQYLIFVTNQYGPDKVTVYGRIIPK
ncbi:MAG: hypothetical protein K8R53_12330 [Bacteroidales bacterium]|nr:hypothetical protein [Bacteroidales bacterium]